MVARDDSGQFKFDEALNGAGAGWSEDQLTTKYTMAAFHDLQRHGESSTPAPAAWSEQDEAEVPAPWAAESSCDAAPHILDVRDLPAPARMPLPTSSGFQGNRTMPIPYGQLGLPPTHPAPRITLAPTWAPPARLPSPRPARTESRRTATLPGMRPHPAVETGQLPPSRMRAFRDSDGFDEPNPFARRSFFSRTTVRAAAAAVGLFGAALSADALFNNMPSGTRGLLPGAITPKAIAAAVSGLLSQPFSTPFSQTLPAPAEPAAPAESAALAVASVASQPGASSDSSEAKVERSGASDQLSAKERRAQKYKERREAAKARREEAKQARLEKAQARREAAQVRHAAWLERRESATGTRSEARQARLEKLQERREAAQARHEEAKQARLEKAQARREAAEAKRAEARQRREAAALARRQPSHDDSSSSLDSSPLDISSSSGKASAGGSGTLRINSRPWSEVFVDGRKVGTTPQLALSLPPGKHKVRLVNSQFDVSKNLDVDVRAGESITRVELLDN